MQIITILFTFTVPKYIYPPEKRGQKAQRLSLDFITRGALELIEGSSTHALELIEGSSTRALELIEGSSTRALDLV